MLAVRIDQERNILQYKTTEDVDFKDIGVVLQEYNTLKEKVELLLKEREETLPLYKEYVIDWSSNDPVVIKLQSLIAEAGLTLPEKVSLLDITTNKLNKTLSTILSTTSERLGDKFKFRTTVPPLNYIVGEDKLTNQSNTTELSNPELLSSSVAYPFSKNLKVFFKPEGISILQTSALITAGVHLNNYYYNHSYKASDGKHFVMNETLPIAYSKSYYGDDTFEFYTGNISDTVNPTITIKTVQGDGSSSSTMPPSTYIPAFVKKKTIIKDTTIDTTQFLPSDFKELEIGGNLPVFAFPKKGSWINGEFKPGFIVGIFEGEIDDIKKRINEEVLEVSSIIDSTKETYLLSPYYDNEWVTKKETIESELRRMYNSNALSSINSQGDRYIINAPNLLSRETPDMNTAWQFVLISDVKFELDEVARIINEDIGGLRWADKVKTERRDSFKYHDLDSVTDSLQMDEVNTMFGYGPKQYLYYSSCPSAVEDSDITYSRVAVYTGSFRDFERSGL